MKNSKYENVIGSAHIPPDQSGILVSVTAQEAGWDTIGFSVRRFVKGDTWQGNTEGNEAAFVILGGRAGVDWGEGLRSIGRRDDVFSGYPHCLYLPCSTAFNFCAETTLEVAYCHVPSKAAFRPRLIGSKDILCEIRGGGNATRQILDVIRPEFEADKLLICEVYTPSGSWSSYPPHKHDIHNPPVEVDLDEVYYFRMDHPDGYAFQRLYNSSGTQDDVVVAHDGDVVLVREGYHPVVAAPGYRVYYLNVLAGSARSMAASDDPRYAHLRRAWPPPDPRVPLVHRES